MRRATDYVLEACIGRPVLESEVDVHFSAAHNASAHAAVSAAVDEAWEAKRRQNPQARLFNGLKFRFHRAREAPAGRLALELGLTDYKEFLGTHYMPKSRLQNLAGAEDVSPFMAHALGVESMVVTRDGFLCLMKRSDKVAEYPGIYCGPGGHAEPSKVVPECGDLQRDAVAGRLSAAPELVLREVFQSPVDEIVGELGVPAPALRMRGLLAIVRNTATSHKPVAVFWVESTLTRQAMLEVYQQGTAPEGYESTRLLFVDLNDRASLQRLVDDNLVAPPTAAGVALLLKCKHDESAGS
ncbi:Nudix hydrolase 9 [Diplonema papillatum]|nr:Nudix hydrolase 9 [Diplonema papillatum]